MQSNASSASSHNWAQTTQAQGMYPNSQQQQQQPQHHRQASNPRQYPGTDTGVDRRDDAQLYAGGGQYGYPQQQQSYANVGQYPGYASNINLYDTTSSPSQPSGSRRQSNPPKGGTPPSAGANPSPSTRYYPNQQPSGISDLQSPYQANSAPPQTNTHHQSNQSIGQPQTAHPYGQYSHQNYGYDGYSNHQYSQHYTQSSTQPQSAAARSSSTAQPATASPVDHHRGSASAGYDYNHQPSSSASYASSYPSHQVPQHQWQTPQSARSSVSGQTAQANQWQGYHMPPQGMQYPGQPPHYPAQPWQQGGYYAQQPMSHPHQSAQPATPAIPLNATPVSASGKKPKKEKGVKVDEYQGLGKRESFEHEEEHIKDGKKGKKGKTPEEKPVPKPPAKSHLHPPRQAQSAWQLFFTDELNKAKAAAAQGNSPGGTPHHAKLNVAQIAKDAGAAYAALNDEQKAYYAIKVQESKDQYAKELAIWQATLTPDDIRAENAFRSQQRKEGKSRKGNLKDPNAPKKPLSAYFLFLKGIRENDTLRAGVWGEESETTKQSVLAAERWRGLSDEEKRPFLQQAEKDKQDYEAARKIYEDEAAARARGEDVPHRHHEVVESSVPVPSFPPMPKVEVKPIPIAAPIIEVPKIEAQAQAQAQDISGPPPLLDTSPTFGEYTRVSSDEKVDVETDDFDHSLELDEFQGFHNPLEGIEFSGLEGINEQANEGWDDLQQFMGGNGDVEAGVEQEEAVVNSGGQTTPSPSPVPAPIADVDVDVDVAPSMEEAVAEQTDIPAQSIQATESEIQDIAAAAEGELSVPHIATDDEASTAIPTEEVNELPPADLPPMVDELPASTIDLDQVDPSAPIPIPAESIIPEPAPIEVVGVEAEDEALFGSPTNLPAPATDVELEAPLEGILDPIVPPLEEAETAAPATETGEAASVNAVEAAVPAADGV